MDVQVIFRYPGMKRAEIRNNIEVPEECTAGELTSSFIRDYEKREGVHFTGASILTLVNGKLAADEIPLRDGDVINIIPVAAGG